MKNIRTALEAAKKALLASPWRLVSTPEPYVVKLETIPHAAELELIERALVELDGLSGEAKPTPEGGETATRHCCKTGKGTA